MSLIAWNPQCGQGRSFPARLPWKGRCERIRLCPFIEAIDEVSEGNCCDFLTETQISTLCRLPSVSNRETCYILLSRHTDHHIADQCYIHCRLSGSSLRSQQKIKKRQTGAPTTDRPTTVRRIICYMSCISSDM